jgi:energy-coupling factor transporter ATP-binding protein EcfA2
MIVPALEVVELSYTFAGRQVPTLANISFKVEPGTSTLLVGRTGSGKSTLLRALAGLIPNHTAGAMRGSVRLFGADTRGATPAELATRVGLVLQSPDDQIVSTKVAAEVAFGLENLTLPPAEIGPQISEALERAGLAGMEQSPTSQLSGGQKQRLALASVLAMRPRLLLLDEPLSQLDACGAMDLLDQLRRLRQDGLAIVLTEHRLAETLPLVERVLVLNEGRLTADVLARDEEHLAEAISAAGLVLPEVAQLSSTLGFGPIMSADRLVERVADGGRVLALTQGADQAEVEHAAPRQRDGPALLRVDQLEFRYRGATASALAEVNFELRAGDRVALVGPNGCGKSTLLAVLARLLKPSQGSVHLPTVDGRVAVGLVVQNPDLTLFCDTVRDELAFGPRQCRLEEDAIARQVATAASRLDIADLLDEPPLALSQGQRLRIAVAAVLALQPRVLLLDEPTTGQDQPQVARVLQAVTGMGEISMPIREHLGVATQSVGESAGGLLFATHDLSCVARYADRVLVLVAGRLVADCSPRELLDDDRLWSEAQLRLPPLFDVRRRLGLHGLTIAELAEELS